MSLKNRPALTDSDAARIADFVAETLDIPVSEIELRTDLAATGRMDSLAVLSIVSFLDEAFGVKLDADKLVPANFASVAQIIALCA